MENKYIKANLKLGRIIQKEETKAKLGNTIYSMDVPGLLMESGWLCISALHCRIHQGKDLAPNLLHRFKKGLEGLHSTF